MGILPYMYRAIEDNVALLHPKEQLGMVADTESVTYQLGCRKGKGDQKEYTCKVLVGEEEIVDLDGGVGKSEVQVRAAERAIEVLQSRQKTSCTPSSRKRKISS